MAKNYKTMSVEQLIKEAKPMLVYQDDKPLFKVSTSLPAALLATLKDHKDEIKAELIRRKEESDKQYEINRARWEADRLARIEADRPILEEMEREVEALVAQIPEGHIRVTVNKVGDADGDPIHEYIADGVKLSWRDVNRIGSASAIRPGALGSFATEHVYSIASDKLAEIKADQEAKAQEKAIAREARDKELAETPIPEAALKAYNLYHGNADKAWEDEDESASLMISKWAPYIERQHGMDKHEFGRLLREAAREADYGINEE